MHVGYWESVSPTFVSVSLRIWKRSENWRRQHGKMLARAEVSCIEGRIESELTAHPSRILLLYCTNFLMQSLITWTAQSESWSRVWESVCVCVYCVCCVCYKATRAKTSRLALSILVYQRSDQPSQLTTHWRRRQADRLTDWRTDSLTCVLFECLYLFCVFQCVCHKVVYYFVYMYVGVTLSLSFSLVLTLPFIFALCFIKCSTHG